MGGSHRVQSVILISYLESICLYIILKAPFLWILAVCFLDKTVAINQHRHRFPEAQKEASCSLTDSNHLGLEPLRRSSPSCKDGAESCSRLRRGWLLDALRKMSKAHSHSLKPK